MHVKKFSSVCVITVYILNAIYGCKFISYICKWLCVCGYDDIRYQYMCMTVQLNSNETFHIVIQVLSSFSLLKQLYILEN